MNSFAPAVFPYLLRRPGGLNHYIPLLPLRLTLGSVSVDVEALVDSGADISVLPYDIGLRVGFDWDSIPHGATVGGSMGGLPTKYLFVQGTVASFAPVRLVFGWAKSNATPVTVGQINFLTEFDVCFFGSRNEFQIQPRTP